MRPRTADNRATTMRAINAKEGIASIPLHFRRSDSSVEAMNRGVSSKIQKFSTNLTILSDYKRPANWKIVILHLTYIGRSFKVKLF